MPMTVQEASFDAVEPVIHLRLHRLGP